MIKNADVFRVMEEWAPKGLAYDWDRVGLQIGSSKKETKKILITLDVLESVADEAIAKGVDLIIAHHPLMFKSVQTIDTETPKGRTLQKLLQHDITVYAAHTNLDIAKDGMNDILSEKLGIEKAVPMQTVQQETLYKIAVFVPATHTESVREALGNAGAGHIGYYSHCSFQTSGQGTFKPLEGTNPFIGKQGEQEFVDEVKIETIAKEEHLAKIINNMLKAHPYEEPAYDIYPLKNKGRIWGLGRIGELADEMDLRTFSEFVKEKLEMAHVRVIGDPDKRIKRCAVLGGSGEKYISLAKSLGADVYVTGDMTFHTAQEAWEMGLAVIDAGHYIEKIIKQSVKQYLEERLGSDVELLISETNTDPFWFV